MIYFEMILNATMRISPSSLEVFSQGSLKVPSKFSPSSLKVLSKFPQSVILDSVSITGTKKVLQIKCKFTLQLRIGSLFVKTLTKRLMFHIISLTGNLFRSIHRNTVTHLHSLFDHILAFGLKLQSTN